MMLVFDDPDALNAVEMNVHGCAGDPIPIHVIQHDGNG